jgi:hypothetical protein
VDSFESALNPNTAASANIAAISQRVYFSNWNTEINMHQ